MDRLLNIIAGFSVLLILSVLISVRRAHIRTEYSMSWLAAGVIILLFASWPELLARATSALGLSDPALTTLIVAGAVFLVVLFRVTLIVSRLKDSNIALAQRVAILEFRLGSVDEKAKAIAGN